MTDQQGQHQPEQQHPGQKDRQGAAQELGTGLRRLPVEQQRRIQKLQVLVIGEGRPRRLESRQAIGIAEMGQGVRIEHVDEQHHRGRAGARGHAVARARRYGGRGDQRRDAAHAQHPDQALGLPGALAGLRQQAGQVAFEPLRRRALGRPAIDHRVDGPVLRIQYEDPVVAIELIGDVADVALVVGPEQIDRQVQVLVGLAPLGVVDDVVADFVFHLHQGALDIGAGALLDVGVLAGGGPDQQVAAEAEQDRQGADDRKEAQQQIVAAAGGDGRGRHDQPGRRWRQSGSPQAGHRRRAGYLARGHYPLPPSGRLLSVGPGAAKSRPDGQPLKAAADS